VRILKATKVRCPTCQIEVEWTTANPFRPFCSERCRLIDLGAWASEQRKIPGAPLSEADDTEVPPARR
jgi:endogenous inhibitor of DNA gyrase (YacG/DUF329 family)